MAYDEQFLLEKLAAFIQELGYFPVSAELKLRRIQDPEFPSHSTFARLGIKAPLATRLVDFCQQHDGYEDVAAICAPISLNSELKGERNATEELETFGSVYLLKAGRYYKIGRTNAAGRRERELSIQLPERAIVVHSIKTDDPPGIEAYWHEAIFARQLIAQARPEDIAVGFSTSGGSANILAGLAEARKRGLLTVGVVGYDGGRIVAERLADHAVVVRSDYIPRIQEVQASIYHVLRGLIARTRADNMTM